MPLSTFKRYEQKYMLKIPDMEALLPVIKKYMTPDPYCTDGRLYSIYNIYFDNSGDTVIQNSLAKPLFKEKLRLRSYYPSPAPDQPVFLEIKRKINKTVTKRRAVLTYYEAKRFIADGSVPAECTFINRQVLEEVAYFISTYDVVPKVYIRYDRYAYFGNDDKEFRLTFDSSIRTRRTNIWFENGDHGSELLSPDQRLMEIKISGSIPIWLADAMDARNIRCTSFSKYGREYTSYSANDQSELSGRNITDVKINSLREVNAPHA